MLRVYLKPTCSTCQALVAAARRPRRRVRGDRLLRRPDRRGPAARADRQVRPRRPRDAADAYPARARHVGPHRRRADRDDRRGSRARPAPDRRARRPRAGRRRGACSSCSTTRERGLAGQAVGAETSPAPHGIVRRSATSAIAGGARRRSSAARADRNCGRDHLTGRRGRWLAGTASVGVIVPVHGWAPYLAETLDAVLAERPGDVVVVDDGSDPPLRLDGVPRRRLPPACASTGGAGWPGPGRPGWRSSRRSSWRCATATTSGRRGRSGCAWPGSPRRAPPPALPGR